MKHSFVQANGIRMSVGVAGEHLPGTPALVLHGFMGSIESMQGVVERLAVDRPVFALDLVGHGESDAPKAVRAYSMDACVEQVAAAVSAPRMHVVGYSMGGRVALSLAVAHPLRVASLLLVGASPGLAQAEARAARIKADEALARQIEQDGLERFVDYWMALPLFASQSVLGDEALARARAQRLRSDPTGLANSLRGMGTGSMPPLHDRLREVCQPVCAMAGSRDAKFVGLARELCEALPDARCEIVDGVGHAVHLEDPAAFARVGRPFLSKNTDPQEISR
jgi:2-succinyl-6-hydroxy-2,4-cyclohexadiene-1-carboxylate synthase